MLVRYDFHIHSGLSPCADKDMTPANIVGFAALSGLNMIAIADHNAIGNVKTAMSIGKAYGVTVVPALELQTLEDIHFLCLFPSYDALERFYESVPFNPMKNRPDIFGEELLFDEDDNVIGKDDRLLLSSSDVYAHEIASLVDGYGGIAIPAHIDRESNGMVAILGGVSPEFDVVELSSKALSAEKAMYEDKYLIIVDSDAHTLDAINTSSEIELAEPTAEALIKYLKKGAKKC